MKSDFEKHAAQEAVDAVERRYRRQRDLDRKMRNRGRFKLVAGLALILAGGVAAWQYFGGVDLLSYPIFKSMASHAEIVTGDTLSESRRGYGEALKHLLTEEVKLSSEMPENLKIKKAEAGERYVVLTPPAKDWFGLFELTRETKDVTVSEFSPVASPRQVKATALQAACAGEPYLVAVRGQVYLFGSKDLKDAERLRNRVRVLIGSGRD